MIEQDYNNVLNLMSQSFPSVAAAMEERLNHPGPFTDELSPFSFPVASSELQPEVYSLLRPTNWFLVAVPDAYFGEGMLMASIRRKQFVQAPEMCFHATPATNRDSVEDRGLLPGITLGTGGRSRMFADSPYYIYASLSEQDAREWCGRFEEDEFLIYPVRSGVAGIDLFIDPCSVDTSRQIVSGYILDTVQVPSNLLGEAIPA